jgi:predicted XRE-type DNA-binding protein
MAKRSTDDTEVDPGSSKVLAGQRLADAQKPEIKSRLVIEITKAVRKLGLTQNEAARRMGIAQPKVSSVLRGDCSNMSEHKLMTCLNRLGYDIEIRVKPTRRTVGHLTLAVD